VAKKRYPNRTTPSASTAIPSSGTATLSASIARLSTYGRDGFPKRRK
jgi:hypothetical protein